MSTPSDEGAGINELRHAVRERLAGAPTLEEGLRERKKKLMRQLISDTATLMFLERGFDGVRVSEVAAACEVSEKTVYNYFPTKESLVLDREEESADALRRALGPGATHASPIDAVIAIFEDELDELVRHFSATEPATFSVIVRFNDLVESTPALKSARNEMMENLAQVAARAMAARVGVDPDDPEPQIAADALLGLWRVYYRAILRYSPRLRTVGEFRDAVMNDVRRAGRLIDTGLWSFMTAAPGMGGRDQVQAASDASNEARRQVLLALKEARKAWRALKAEADAHARDADGAARRGQPGGDPRGSLRQDRRREAEQIRREVYRTRKELRDEIQRTRKEFRDEVRSTIREAKGRGRAR